MDTCFFTSNYFIKSIEVVPSITWKYPSCLRRNSSLRECMSSSLIRCHLGSSSSSHDDIRAVIKSDWKTFRARLVAAERALSIHSADPSSSAVDVKTAMDYVPQVILGQKWAHRVYEPEKGCLLIATEKLDGVHIYARTVILIISVSRAGPSGVILNRPSLMSMKETKTKMLDLEGTFSSRPLCFGGPVKEEIFLMNTKGNDVNGVGKSGRFEQVMQDLYFGTKESVGWAAGMVKRNMVGVGDVMFFDGCCGWQNKEIRLEINTGFWTLAACSADVIRVS